MKPPSLRDFSDNEMSKGLKRPGRPSQINNLTVELIVKARSEGLTFAEIAAFLKVSPRTLYQWQCDGRDLCILCEFHGLKPQDFIYSDQAKIQLYEALKRKDEDTAILEKQDIRRALEERIMQKEWEIENREADRKQRARKKKERTAKQREQDRLRKRKQRSDQKFENLLETIALQTMKKHHKK